MAPFIDFYAVRLQQHRLAPNLGALLGLSPAGGLVLLVVILTVISLLMVHEARRT